ncbi:hypothetical protein D3C80_1517320 [compost metagenome]
MHHAHGILDRDDLRLARRITVDFRSAKAGQHEGDFARHQMRMVELGGDIDRQFLIFKSLDDQRTVGRCPHEVAAERDEGLRLASQHGGYCFDGVVAGFARHGDAEFFFQCV